jgi:DNA-binding response OmpR family regulator
MKIVLVMDDENRCREVAAQILSNAGFQVLVARDGFQAVGVLSPVA